MIQVWHPALWRDATLLFLSAFIATFTSKFSLMPFTYKTLYIPAPDMKPKSAFATSIPEFNGDQLARDVQAALLEMESQGYRLHTMTPVQSSRLYGGSIGYSFTDGVLLVFEKINP
jgi:hypothetical protein